MQKMSKICRNFPEISPNLHFFSPVHKSVQPGNTILGKFSPNFPEICENLQFREISGNSGNFGIFPPLSKNPFFSMFQHRIEDFRVPKIRRNLGNFGKKKCPKIGKIWQNGTKNTLFFDKHRLFEFDIQIYMT